MRIHRPALLTALVGLVGATLVTSVGATARQPAGPTGASGPAGVRPIALPGLQQSSYDVTLPTGDRVVLTSAGAGHYSIAAVPTGRSGAVRVHTHGDAKGASAVSAVPSGASALVVSGALDANLFDPTWLAGHGDDGPSGHIPVTVQYAGSASAATLTSRAGALAGATLVATHPATSSIDVSVPAARAVSFWAALTDTKAAPKLASGASHAWPTGHRSGPPAAAPATGAPVSQVTETLSRTQGDTMLCNGYWTTMCTGGDFALFGLAGDGMGVIYPATGFSCVDADPCTTYRATFSVPDGIYSAHGYGFFDAGSSSEQVDLTVPQFTVAGDTSLSVDVNAAQQITVSTPRPSTAFVSSESNYRGAANGDWQTSIDFATAGNYWALPSPAITVGTFHLDTNWVLGQPPVTMTATGSQRLALDASYWGYRTALTAGNIGAVRFTGRHRLQLVDAGYGRPEDYAGLDARGKLALIDIGPNVWCVGGSLAVVLDSQLNAAIAAGVAGLLIDPSTPEQYPGQACSSVIPQWYMTEDPIKMPFADLPVDQVKTLRSMLGHGPVTVDVNGYDGNSPYVYTPLISYEGRIPSSLHTTIDGAQLTAVTQHLHATQPATPTMYWGEWQPDEYFTGGTYYEFLATPGDFTEYRGPARPDTVYEHELDGAFPQQMFDVAATRGGTSSDTWTAGPAAPGPSYVPTDVLAAQPGKFSTYPSVLAYCTFCRQGNTLYPVTYLPTGVDLKPVNGAYAFLPGSIHLYQDGQEIQPTPFAGGLVSYQLPTGSARYQLSAQIDGAATTWDFASSAPTADRTPVGTGCLGALTGSTDPCAPDPLVFLRYDAGVDPTNAVSAPGQHTLQVTAYHQDPGAPAVRSLAVWTSTDGGTTWHAAPVSPGRDGSYTARYSLPAPGSTDGALSIKAQATDAGSNDVTQTLIDAVPLTSQR